MAMGALMLLIAPRLLAQQMSAVGMSLPPDNGLPRAVLVPLSAPADDRAAEQIAREVTRSLSLMLHLSGSVNLVNADFLDPTVSYERSTRYFRETDAPFALFGRVTAGPDGYLVTVALWRGELPPLQPKKLTRRVAAPAAAYSAANELALEVVSDALGRKLETATVSVANTGSLPHYSIYADGRLVARDRSNVEVLTGERTVIVAVPGPLGDEPVETFHVNLASGKNVGLALNAAAAAGETSGGVLAATPPSSAQARNPPATGPAGTGRATTPQATHPATAAVAPAPPAAGSLTVLSTPGGATVLLDGMAVGTTPLSLDSVSPGAHELRLEHALFLPLSRSVTVAPGRDQSISLALSVDRTNPRIAEREKNPWAAVGVSLGWSVTQSLADPEVHHFFGSPINPQVGSFWTQRSYPNGMSLSATGNPMDLAVSYLNLALFRVGNRYAGSPRNTLIGDVLSLAGAGLVAVDNIPYLINPSGSTLSSSESLSALGFIGGIGGSVLYDAISAPFAAKKSNRELIAYIEQHGELPPLVVRQQHRVIVETGGDSILRVGYRLPILTSYLSLEATAGLSAATLSPFVPELCGEVMLSAHPFGTSTGAVRPEIHFGVRARTGPSSASTSTSVTSGSGSDGFPVALEFGTGSDWIGASFDLFTRAGVSYDLTRQVWGEFYSVGTRLF